MLKRDCPCPKASCERHGDCDACGDFNDAIGKMPFCERPQSFSDPRES